ncbi:MAG TPA: D-glycerate dehydrogenase [Terriglobia bacterium]|nr:D-glycerate dehydrogenase [Terriglobia bacterium]
MPPKPRVFATRPLPPSIIEFLSTRCEVSSVLKDEAISADELAAICREQAIEGILSSATPVNRQVVEQAARLRVVSQLGKGYDNVDVAACTARKIIVTNVIGAPEESTADITFALILSAARRIVEGDHYVRDGQWKSWLWKLLWGFDVHGKTIGLYGFGTIGQAVARRATGFSMRILYHTRRRAPEDVERKLNAQYVDAETLIRESDFLSLHTPLTPETRHLIAAREFGWMKSTAFLINTARGPVVNEEALVEALKAKRIAGAALDVFEHEPNVHPELIKMQNVVLLPHLGSATEETRTRMARLAAENLLAALDGQRPHNLVNPEVLDGRGSVGP